MVVPDAEGREKRFASRGVWKSAVGLVKHEQNRTVNHSQHMLLKEDCQVPLHASMRGPVLAGVDVEVQTVGDRLGDRRE